MSSNQVRDMARPLPIAAFLLLAPTVTAQPPDFDRQIAPLLASRCLECHSGRKPKGDLDLSRRAGTGAVVVGGKPEESELWKRVAAGEMPPKKPLPGDERKLLKDWIAAGARWGSDPIDPFRFTTSSRAGYDWWALRPLTRPAVPEVPPAGTVIRNDIDRFVLAKLRDRGLSLSGEADRRTLIRRVYFDLVGLPPTPEEVERFVKGRVTFEKVVDRLLDSAQYGERWARHWLDVVRYGESDGFERNAPRPNAWHYRDWVIAALNADLPYPDFVRMQIAGDVLRPGDPDGIRATGFLVAGVHNTVLGNDRMRAIARQDELEDIVGSVSQTFLGLTANCARCHDHKFDPISQTDYYRFSAALGGVGFGERLLPDTERDAAIARLTTRLKKVELELEAIEAPARKAALAARGMEDVEKLPPSPIAAWDFRKGANDHIGRLNAKAVNGATRDSAGAVLDGKSTFFRTPPIPFDLKSKTLEAWVKLDNLTQRGGGVMSVQTPDGSVFDAIVFSEKEPGQWMAGSEFFHRTQPLGGPAEAEATKEFVHVAITYSADGTITGYRNGRPYGKGYASKGPVVFAAGKAVIAFGCRHEPVGGNKMLAGALGQARLYDRALSADQVATSFAAGMFVSEAELDAKLSQEQRATRVGLRKCRDDLAGQISNLRRGAADSKVYANVPQAPGNTRVLLRGDIDAPGSVVAPGGLRAIVGPKSDFGQKPDAADRDRRIRLAEWITTPNNPLLARVIVNRVWHYHSGTGIVETPNDFGFNGGRPSHPELLDWLATEFIDKKHSLKALHRLIVTSATYRQSSAPRKGALEMDSGNRLLWRYQPRRMEGEAIRDSMLAVSGFLNPEVGGKGFSDYRERNFNGTAFFEPFDPVGLGFHRRSIYRFTPRGANQGLLDVFDCPDPAAASPRRSITTTPLQALSLWNSGFALRMAAAFANRVEQGADGVEKQIELAWQLAYQRDPTREESALAARLVEDHGLKALCRVLFNSNEFVMVE